MISVDPLDERRLVFVTFRVTRPHLLHQSISHLMYYISAQYSIPPMFVENKKGKYEWRTHVLLSEPFWREWFIGLSGLFLKSPCAKMLMLADTDRLDKPLTIGQMQGKYELCIVGCGVGHTLHEDAPKKVADKLLHFVDRNQFIKLWKVNKKFKLKKNKPK
eukprot:999760_1